ncbi:D-alanyl-D-alanine carboxypeptidase/D-alanyl-D-alanine-endopeptidase (penicillin-binding protein 4) [Natronocella acetinitrilica]|uniref:D-alanyl-D-alanine carboxypeptidase/D-alanyl-D-alanine-endopeptidase (Penicillin-binding protein 4) n=1 Tax=Natronocella acetinitrilica TaxID=414046 RepID=A0AAE3KCM6_9GAMM|nr:D-alanyl-D-alanine carboxypeptidase/D-alanyl-D-alanine-endopeptidase [Natronocella acetinitrilica]MCP1675936.1 D-alanyl-D-alanine carboxypeptidase/D-alanyl-D-alanine-endopeptidase (penicillin-binding protein 4) [Natronocella acetinitrilica]
MTRRNHRSSSTLLLRVVAMTVSLLPMVPIAASGLPDPVARVLDWQRIDPDSLSIWVQRVGETEPLLSHLPDRPRNPASVMKLFTTFAALEQLGPAYRWRTEVFVDKPPVNGRVERLWIRGHGDPHLLDEDVWRLAATLQRSGVRHIDGPLMLDISHFALDAEDPAAFDNAPTRAYNQPPHALLVNFNAVRFHVFGDRSSGEVRVEAEPNLPGLQLENRLRLEDRSCGGFQRGVGYRVADQGRVQFDGSYPARCEDTFRLVRRIVEPEDYLEGLFSIVWRQWGGEFAGGWRHGVWLNDHAKPFAVHESRSLGEIIRLANKYSSNVITRHLKLTLGAEMHGEPATHEKGVAAMLDVLDRHGVETKGMILDNAAGLSRTNRVSARQVAQVLAAGRQSQYMAEYVSSLAIAGLDGTARRRFTNAPEAGRMHLKTGRLNGVSAIAGYVRAADDQDYIVVAMLNSDTAHQGPGEAVQDALLRWVHER